MKYSQNLFVLSVEELSKLFERNKDLTQTT